MTQLITSAYLARVNAITKESTGFVSPEDVIVTYDPVARTVTLTGTVEAYWQGLVVHELVSGWVSTPHDATVGAWFLLYDGTNFVWQMTTAWTFDQLQIAFVSYGTSNKFAIREPHGFMQWQSHKELHETIGTYYNSGGDIAGITLASTTPALRRPSVSSTTVSDEDLTSVITALADNGPYTTLTLTGTGTSTLTTGYAEIVPVTGANPNYNAFATPNWIQTPMANNSYMSIWLVAVPVTADAGSQLFRYLWVQGQSNGSLTSEQGKTFNGLNLGQLTALSPEFCAIGKVIIRYQGGNWDITSVEKITGTRVSSTSFPAGNYLSTVAVTAPITGDGTVGNPLAMAAATGTVDGYLSATTQTIGGAKTFNTGITAPYIDANAGTYAQGRLYRAAVYGTILTGIAGSTYDLSLVAANGNPVGGVPTGTTSWTFLTNSVTMGALTATAGAFSGVVSTTDATDSTSSTSAASIKTAGGLSVAKAGNFGGGLTATTATFTGVVTNSSGAININAPAATNASLAIQGGALTSRWYLYGYGASNTFALYDAINTRTIFTVDNAGATSFGTLPVTMGALSATTLGATGALQILSGTAVPAGGTAGAGLKMSSTANLGVFFGSGAPTLSAAKGSLYMRTDGTGTNDRMYVNTNGTTTWTAVVTVA